MSSQTNSKVRFVRCPKCQLVLPELADIPVYKCGGCATVLQAKNRKRAPPKNNLLDQNEISSPSEEACPPSKGLSEWNKSDQGNCSKELPRQLSSTNELPSSSGVSCLEKEDERTCSLDEETEQYENESRDHHQFAGGENFSNRLATSDQLTCPELASPIIEAKEDAKGAAVEEREKLELDKDTGCPTHETEQDMEGLALQVTQQLELEEDNFLVDDCTVNDQNRTGVNPKSNSLDESSTYSECVVHRDEVSTGSGAHDGNESKYLVEQVIGRGQNNFQGYNAESPENVRYAKETSSSTEFARDFEKQSSVCSDMYQSILNESIISDTLMTTDHEQFEQFHKEMPSDFDRISSMDTLANQPVNICRSEPPINLRNVIRSPTDRSYYAYDGSASSCDGDDHIPDQYHHQSVRKFKEACPVSHSEFLLDGRSRVNHTMNGESKMVQRATNFFTATPGRSHQATEGSNWIREEWPQSRKRGQASGGRMTLDKDEHATTFPFISTGSHAGHKHGNSSNYRKNMTHHSSLLPPRMPSDSEPDKIQLLRMVYELEDQLRQTRITKRMANGRFSAELMRDEDYNPSYYDQFLEDGELSGDLNYSRYPVRCSHGKGWPPQRKSTRIPFSAEAYRHQADCLCSHCSPKLRRFSEQLHPSVCYNKVRGVACSSCNCCNHLQSDSSSPQHYSSSEYSRWDRDTKSDDRRHKDYEMKKRYLREKYSKMRHLRPVAGGAPIISCYYCNKLLQLPADFVLFKRRCHQLRCNACRKVLKFTLQNQIHVVPFHAEALAPPPSEVDDNSGVTDQQNMAYEYHLNSCPRTERISCSDDLGPSFCRSISTEGECSVPPIESLGRTRFNRDRSSSSSWAPTKDRKMKSVMREPFVGTFGSPEPSTKMSKWGKTASSEIQEVGPNGGSPLHRLMGYNSPSEVIHW